MKILFTLAFKDLLLLYRDKGALFWVLVFPIMFALFFGSFYSGILGRSRSPMKVSVIDEDESDFSKIFLSRFQASDAVEVKFIPEEQSRKAVREGGLAAYITLKKGLGESSKLGNAKQMPIEVAMDPSRVAEEAYLQGILLRIAFEMQAERFFKPRSATAVAVTSSPEAASPVGGPKVAITPVTVESQRPPTPFGISFPSAILWGLLGCASTFAISVAQERAAGTLLRLRFAPISRAQILAGKGLGCFIACMAVMIILLALARVFCGLEIYSYSGLLAATLCSSFCFVGIMMFVSVMGKTEPSVAGAGWGLFIPMSMFGGAMVPLVFMPMWMQKVGHASPVKWSILALEGAIWRGFGPREMLLPCLLLTAFGVAFFLGGLWLMSREEA